MYTAVTWSKGLAKDELIKMEDRARSRGMSHTLISLSWYFLERCRDSSGYPRPDQRTAGLYGVQKGSRRFYRATAWMPIWVAVKEHQLRYTKQWGFLTMVALLTLTATAQCEPFFLCAGVQMRGPQVYAVRAMSFRSETVRVACVLERERERASRWGVWT